MRAILRKLIPTRYLPTAILERFLKSLTCGGTRVIKGPFEGTILRSESYFSPIYNKLLGCYERELHPVLEEVIAMSPSIIIDIGAAEGYYACGLARRCKERTRHLAFESDFRMRYVLRRNLEANNIDSMVEVFEYCSVDALSRLIGSPSPSSGPTFILCDIEGMEGELLDPELVPGLRDCIILVELHDFAIQGVSVFLRERFEASHLILEIVSELRNSKDLFGDELPFWARLLPATTIDRFAKERPYEQKWFFLRPRGR